MGPLSYIVGGVTLLSWLATGALYLDLRIVTGQRDRLQAAIDNPVTGYAARLVEANANGATCIASVQAQSAAIKAVSDKAEGVKKALDDAARANATGRSALASRIADIMKAVPKTGENDCLAAFGVLTGPVP